MKEKSENLGTKRMTVDANNHNSAEYM